MKFSIFNTLFVFCAVFLATSGVAFAATCQCGWTTCATNQYCVENYYWDQEEQIWDYDYYCEDCPSGQVHSSSDCYQCVVPPCQGYTDCPSGIGGSGKKCKVVANGCPSGSGCTKYEICDTSNNAVTYQATSGCHIEGSNDCQPNTVSCDTFSQPSIDFGSWTCRKAEQLGQATWDSSQHAWNTENCTCKALNHDIYMEPGEELAACKQGDAEYIVLSSEKFHTTSVSDWVRYTSVRSYCKKCYPGYLPTPGVASSTYQIDTQTVTDYHVPDTNDNNTWGVKKCATRVEVPHYADGCNIDFNASTGAAAVESCKKSCPIGTKTAQTGATSVSACNQLDADQRFQDDTGIFTIGSSAQCSNNP